MTESQARYKKVRIVEKVQEKLKEGIENYRAAGDAPAKYDVYDVIEEIFAAINPPAADESKVTVDEVSGCLRSSRSEEHTSELQSQSNLVCRLLLEKKKKNKQNDGIVESQKE